VANLVRKFSYWPLLCKDMVEF